MESNSVFHTQTVQPMHVMQPTRCANARQSQPDLPKDYKKKELNALFDELEIGQRIQSELAKQQQTVAWLAEQLCMDRTSLYYTFKQKTIDLELLMLISVFLNHDFMQDVIDICNHNHLF